MASHTIIRVKRKLFESRGWVYSVPIVVNGDIVKFSTKHTINFDYETLLRLGRHRRGGKLGESIIKIEVLKVTDAQLKKMTGR